MTLTQSRVIQYIGLLLVLGILAVSYWYFSVRAGVTTNSSVSQPGGTGRLDSGLAGYWKLDETTGSSASDSSTNGNTGTLTNMENGDWVAGQIGNSLDFDGSNEYATMTYSSALSSNTGITYAFWASPDLNEEKGILGGLNGEDGSVYNFIIIDNDGSEAGQPKIAIARNIGGSTTSREVQFTYSVSTWLHYVYTYDGVQERVYINGAKLGEWSQTGNFASNTEYGLVLGRAYTTGSGTEYDGKLDEVRVYSRALPADEVANLYRLTTPTAVDTGLKGYWSFNAQDMSGTTAYDRSGTGNTGTLTSGPTATRGQVGQALNFDGSNDYVEATDNSALDIGNTDDLTVTGWFSRDTFTTADVILAKRTNVAAGNTGYVVDITAGDTLVLRVADGLDEYRLETVQTFTTSDWHHFAAVWDQDSAAGSEIYIDGVAAGATDTGTIGNIDDLSNAQSLQIGTSSDDSDPFDGKLDEVRVYNRAVTAAEVKGLYDTGSTDKLNTSAGQAQGTGRLDSGLVGYWRYDDGSGTSATDSSTNASTGTLTSGPTWTTGQIGSAVNFDGTDDYITDPGATAVDIRDSLSLATWVKFDTLPANGQAISLIRNVVSGNYLYRLQLFNTFGTYTLEFTPGGGGDTRSGVVSVTTGVWYHMAVTFNTVSDQVNVYLNGAIVGTGTDTVGGGYAGGTGTLYFGSNSGTSDFLDGQMDEVRIYDRALSSDEMAALARLTSPTGVDTGLKGYWSFNGQDVRGTTAYDRSGAGNTGTLSGGPTLAAGQVGQSLSFDGTNDYLTAGAAVSAQSLADKTICAWINPETIPATYGAVMAKLDGVGWQVELTNDSGANRIGLYQTFSTSNGTWKSPVDSVPFSRWTHVCIAYNNASVSNKPLIYLDGNSVLVETIATPVGTADTDASSPLQVGAGYFSGNAQEFFDGRIDEARLYNRILTASEISSLYATGQSDKQNSSLSQPQGTGRLDSGLAGYWKLDETTGSSASDSSTNGNNGTLTNMENGDWVAGRIGNGLNFDGSNEYVDLGTAGLTNPAQLSGAAWVKPTDLAFTETYFIFSNRSGGNAGWSFGMTDPLTCSSADCAKLSFTLQGVAEYRTTDSWVLEGQWTHVAFSWNGSTVTFYVNGALVESFTTGSMSAGSNLLIGASGPAPGSATTFMDGIIDEARIYSRALSADEMAALARLTSPTGVDTGLKGYWSFNGQDVRGTTAYDRSGAGNNGTLTGNAAVSRAKLGQGIMLDGTGDYVNIGNVLALSLPISVSMWVNPSALPGTYAGIFTTDKTQASAHSHSGMWLSVNSDGTLDASYGDNAFCSSGGRRTKTTTGVLSTNTWQHVTAVVNGATDMQIYINGVDAGGSYTGTGGSIVYTSNNAAIGRVTECTDGSGRDFTGKIDETRIYSRALTAAEIKSLYNSGR